MTHGTVNTKDIPMDFEQPPGTYRFGADALLLASFAAESRPRGPVADLGCGCGVVGLKLSLLFPGLRVIGLDRDPLLVEAAARNAERFHISSYAALTGDVADDARLRTMRDSLREAPEADSFGMVVCNPPWGLEGHGRRSPHPSRNSALFGDKATLPAFFRAADKLLGRGGILALACGAARLQDALETLPSRLKPVRLRMVHGHRQKNAAFFLLRAIKNSRAALVIEPPCYLNE